MKKLFACFVLMVSSMGAHAGLVGTEVSCSIEPSVLYNCDLNTNEVSVRPEFFISTFFDSQFAIDFSDTAVQIENISQRFEANAFEMLSLSVVGGLFSDIAFNVISGVDGVELSDFSFDGENLTFDFDQTVWDEGGFVLINFVNNPVVPMPTVPTLALILAGLVVLRRTKK